jgi:hypothetical protein
MTTQNIIVAMAIVIALSVGGAIMITNHYEVSQPFNPLVFSRFDRWTGTVELCSSSHDNTTYCAVTVEQLSREIKNLSMTNMGYLPNSTLMRLLS